VSEDIVGQIRDVKGRTWQEAFYIQTKAFLEKNSEHIKEVERLKAEVVRLTKAGDAFYEGEIGYYGEQILNDPKHHSGQMCRDWNAAKEGKQSK
jgi:hypothetical protein